VLVLRAGLGAGPPRTRRGVARALDIRVVRVRRLERSGLRHVRAIARTDGCGGTVTGTSLVSATGVAADTGGAAGAATGSGSEAAPGAGSSSEGGGDSANGGGATGDRGDVRGESESSLPITTYIPNPADGGVELALAIVLVLLAAAAGFATPSIRDRLRRG
jgi:hypothetical protein